MTTDDLPKDAARRLIPGAYDRTTVTHRQPGSMGGGASGAGIPSGISSMDAATIAERQSEGGSLRGRHRSVTPESRRGPALRNAHRNGSRSTGPAWWLRVLRAAR